jgi:hypothetical protein
VAQVFGGQLVEVNVAGELISVFIYCVSLVMIIDRTYNALIDQLFTSAS